MKSILVSFFLMFCIMGSAQKQLNDYKYIIVPKRLAEFKKDNQYQTSTLIKYLLTKKGYTVVYEGAFPEDLASNVCLGLTARIEDNSSMFMTKIIIRLRDCTMEDVVVSQEGRSRSKEYKSAYTEGITNACKSFDNLNYKYTPKIENDTPITVSFKNDVKNLEEEVKAVQKETESVELPLVEDIKEVKETPSATVVEKPVVEIKEEVVSKGVLYAQEILNGFQLVDSAPSIRIKMYKSSMPNMYHAEGDENVGIIYQTAGKWFFEYYSNEKLIVEKLNIKF